MNIFKNLGPFAKLSSSLSKPNSYKKKLDAAKAAGDFDEERRLLHELTQEWGVDILNDFGVDLEVRGRENFPKSGAVLFVCNHQSFADIPVLCAAIDNLAFGFVARDNLREMPLLGSWMDRIHCVLLEREDTRAALKSMMKGIELIKNGYSLLIFPEGTRAKGGPMGAFKPGALKLATKPKVPIVPLSLNGTFDMYEKTGKFAGAPAKVIVHEPIETKDLSREEMNALSDKVHDIIETGLLQLKEEMGH